MYGLQISQTIPDVFKTGEPESGIFDIPDVCGEQTNSFFKEVPTTQARCHFQNGGGWMVILRRQKNATQQVSFNRLWTDYERGFGDLNTEFWYGLRNMHCLTNREEVELQVEVRQNDGTGGIWTYGYLKIDGPETNYTLHIGQAQGPSGGYDAMAYHNGTQFTTTDWDNDAHSGNCATYQNGSGWWYKSCYYALLTGSHSISRLHWRSRQGTFTNYPFAEMRLRPKNCKITEEQSCN